MNLDITIGELDKKLKTEIFNENDLEIYKRREDILKDYINICFNNSLQLTQLPHQEERKVPYYKQYRIKRSLRRLSDYVAYLAYELDKNKIIHYFEKPKHPLIINTYNDIDVSFIIANSYYGSIKHDLYWIDNLRYYDALAMARGDFEIDNLSGYLPDSFAYFKKTILPYFKSQKLLGNFKGTLDEIVVSYNSKSYRGCNLLILTMIEGMVRVLGGFLVKKQELDVDVEEFNSLDSFLRKIPWKSDFIITVNKYRLITGDWDFRRENREPLEEKNINLKERLDFLRRRFKEDRDLILHGLESDYGKTWNLFINFSALEHMYDTIKYYLELYKE